MSLSAWNDVCLSYYLVTYLLRALCSCAAVIQCQLDHSLELALDYAHMHCVRSVTVDLTLCVGHPELELDTVDKLCDMITASDPHITTSSSD